MAGITLAEAESRLAAYLAAEEKVLLGQAYQIDGRSMTRANLAQIQEGIDLWNKRVQEISSRATGSGRRRSLSPGW